MRHIVSRARKAENLSAVVSGQVWPFSGFGLGLWEETPDAAEDTAVGDGGRVVGDGRRSDGRRAILDLSFQQGGQSPDAQYRQAANRLSGPRHRRGQDQRLRSRRADTVALRRLV